MKNQSVTCHSCGKPLSDPISVEIGIGPVCRVMNKTAIMKEKTLNIFSNRSEYQYGFDHQALWIEDLGGMKSVTNDIENVISDIVQIHSLEFLLSKKIMYKDSMAIWDGVRLVLSSTQAIRIEFYPLTETDFYNAKSKLLNT